MSGWWAFLNKQILLPVLEILRALKLPVFELQITSRAGDKNELDLDTSSCFGCGSQYSFVAWVSGR